MPEGMPWTLLFLAFITTFVLALMWGASRIRDGLWPFAPKEE